VTKQASVPPAYTFAWTVVQALRELNGSGTNEEINERCVKLRGLTEEQQSVPGPRGGTQVHYRLAWARTLAKALGLITSSGRGVWALTEAGKTVTQAKVDDLRRARSRDRASQRKAAVETRAAAGDQVLDSEDLFGQDPPTDEDPGELGERNWKEQLLSVLKAMSPDAFERLTQRLLREAGFTNVLVTGGSGDGGIDGTGVYRAMRLMSFPVYFQCKRYFGTVGASKVRDFRGAMVGRGDKGLLVTTGTFTADARAEATRDGAPPIDLVDGDQLAELPREFKLGVTTTEHMVYEHSVDPTFFAAI
jgi:restriction system protein